MAEVGAELGAVRRSRSRRRGEAAERRWGGAGLARAPVEEAVVDAGGASHAGGGAGDESGAALVSQDAPLGEEVEEETARLRPPPPERAMLFMSDEEELRLDTVLAEADQTCALLDQLSAKLAAGSELAADLAGLIREKDHVIQRYRHKIESFQVKLKRIKETAASRVEKVMKKSEEQAIMIESLHRSVAMYKKLCEEQQKTRSTVEHISNNLHDDGRKDLMVLFEGSQEVSKKTYEQVSERARKLDEELTKLRTELGPLRSERDKAVLEADFARDRLNGYMAEIEAKEKYITTLMNDIAILRNEVTHKVARTENLEIELASSKSALDEQYKRWRSAQDNYERQVILQSETIQELTNTSKQLSSLQQEMAILRQTADAQKAENAETEISLLKQEKSRLQIEGIPENVEAPVARAPAAGQQTNQQAPPAQPAVAAPVQPSAASAGPNANPLNLFPQGVPRGEANPGVVPGAGSGALDALRQLPQPMLQELGKQNPQILRLIQEDQAEFPRLVNETPQGGLGGSQNKKIKWDAYATTLFAQICSQEIIQGNIVGNPSKDGHERIRLRLLEEGKIECSITQVSNKWHAMKSLYNFYNRVKELPVQTREKLFKIYANKKEYSSLQYGPLKDIELLEIMFGNKEELREKPNLTDEEAVMFTSIAEEWDALMLSNFALEQQLHTARQELSHALYQHDAACRVIARLKKERAESRTLSQAERQIPISAGGPAPAAVTNGKRALEDEVGADGKKIHPGINPVMIDELTECNSMLSAQRKKRQVPPSLAPIDALDRYTQISSHPLHKTNKPGILSIDIDHSKDIIATGGIDTNAVVFDRPSGQVLCTVTGHSKKVTSLKFVPRDELLITGSADKTVRIWQGSKDGSYDCRHTLKDHGAEVEAVTVHATQKYFVTASRDNTWCFYDISTGSCLTQVGEASGQDGYTAAAFHPDGLILGTGTSEAVVKIWDVKSQTNVAKFDGHVGAVTAISFSENGYFLATAALDGVKLWDLRKLRNFRTLSPYDPDTPTSSVEFDFRGNYLAVAGADIRVYQVANVKSEWNLVKTLPDLSGTGKVTSVRFGTGAKYVAVGSMDRNLRIFGLPGDEAMEEATDSPGK